MGYYERSSRLPRHLFFRTNRADHAQSVARWAGTRFGFAAFAEELRFLSRSASFNRYRCQLQLQTDTHRFSNLFMFVQNIEANHSRLNRGHFSRLVILAAYVRDAVGSGIAGTA